MSPLEIIESLKRSGVHLHLIDNELKGRVRRGRSLTDEQKKLIHENKAALIQLLSSNSNERNCGSLKAVGSGSSESVLNELNRTTEAYSDLSNEDFEEILNAVQMLIQFRDQNKKSAQLDKIEPKTSRTCD